MADKTTPDTHAAQLEKVEALLKATRSWLLKNAPGQLPEIEAFVADLKRTPKGKPISLKSQKAIRTLFFAQLEEKVASYTRSLDSLIAPMAAGNAKAIKLQKTYQAQLSALLEAQKKLSGTSQTPKAQSGQMPAWVAQQLSKKLPK